jgi:hypothetical protein
MGLRVETSVGWKLWLSGASGLAIAGLLCLASPTLGGLTLIVLALAAVAVFAFRQL